MVQIIKNLDKLKKTEYPDVLLVLGGEDPVYRTRSNHAAMIYFNLGNHPPLVLSGNYSNPKPGLLSEASQMKDYLINNMMIPEERIFLEENSTTTLENIVFSKPIIDDVLSGFISKRVGLVTDGFHMPRASWLADYVFPENYDVKGFPTFNVYDQRLKEFVLKNIYRVGFFVNGVKRNDFDSAKAYVDKHYSPKGIGESLPEKVSYLFSLLR